MKDGTFSINGQKPFGYVVAINGYEQVYNVGEITQDDVNLFIEKHHSLLEKPDYFYGIWTDDGKVYLDVSKCYSGKKIACFVGILNDQKAIYDLAKGESIFLPSPQNKGTFAQQSSYAMQAAEQICNNE